MLLFLFSFSNVLQDYAMDRTRNAIRALMKLRPNQALIRRGDELVSLPVEKIVVGDRYVVRPGDRIPLDGVVIEGESTVDQASITGESMPVAKGPGQTVLAGTINQNGSLEAEVTRLAKDSTLAKLIKLVEEAQSEKAHTQRFLDKAEQYYALGVIVFTILVAAVPVFFLGEAFNTAFYRAMTVMVAASPCALIISTPASILSAIGNGARKGVLFKGGVYMEQAAGIKVIAFDKTGTLTQGKPAVTDVVTLNVERSHVERDNVWHGNEDELLALAAAVEAKSEHPLAQAVVEAARRRNLEVAEAQSFQATTGKGARGLVNGRDIRVGNQRYFQEFDSVGLAEVNAAVEQLQADGKTAIIVAQMSNEGQVAHFLGVIALADTVRPDAAPVVAELKSLGVQRVVMLTGDNKSTAQAVARELSIDRFEAEVLPERKSQIVRRLQSEGRRVAMAGDGINDAPALAQADVGIAMGTGTDVAMESAAVTLLKGDLMGIVRAHRLSRHTMKNIRQNLFFAFFYNALGVPVAAGVLYPAFGLLLNPMIGSAAMALSSVSVIANSLRLNRCKL
ncbi:MAG: heavy metal translocating P-type ATPase [Anaerolineales bacterium]|nr:heavy metal translocating P-type ATPase [Anaerolineales bacterium]